MSAPMTAEEMENAVGSGAGVGAAGILTTEGGESTPQPEAMTAGGLGAVRSRGLLSEAGVLAGAQVAVVALGLVAVRVVTEILDPAVYGAVALILAGLGLAKGVFVAPWLGAQLRFHPEAKVQGGVGALYRSVIGLGLVGTAVAAACVWAGLGLTVFRGSEGWSLGLPLVAAVWLAADGTLSFLLNHLNAELRQGWLAAVRVADAFLRPALGIGAVLAFAGGALLFVGGQAGGAALLAVPVAVVWFRQRTKRNRAPRAPAGEDRWRSPILRYAAPLIPLAAIQWAIHLGDRYILQFYHGSGEVGLYSAAYALASQPFLMLSGILALVLRPRLFRAAGEDATAALQYRRSWMWLVAGTGSVGLLLLIVLRRWVGLLLLGPEYRGATGILPIIGAAYLLLILGQGLETWSMAQKRTGQLLTASLVSMAVSLAAALWLIPPLGLAGAAWATLLGLGAYPAAIRVAQVVFGEHRPR